jgi:hypothetical protein
VASREQLAGIEQVNQAIAGMDVSTQQNAAMVEQSTAAASNMASQARDLVATVARFRLNAAAHLRADTAPVRAAQASAAGRIAPAVTTPALRNHTASALPPGTGNRAASSADGEWKDF